MKVKKKVPELRFPEFSGEWEKDKLNNHAEIYDGTHQTPSYKERGIRFVSVENIKDILGSDKFISEDAFEKEYKNKMPEKGDILMTRIGDIGTPAYIDFNEKIAYYVTLALIKCNSTFVYSKFLYYLIQGKNFQKELDKRTLHIAFPKKINLGEIGLCSIDLPIIPEQQKIGNFLSTLDKRIELQQQKVENLEKEKKGIMQKIFSQEIRFKDENGNDYPEWEEKKLGEIATLKNGYAFSSKSYSKKGKYPIITITNVTGDIYTKLNEVNYINELPNNISNFQVLSFEDILISLTGNVGRVSFNSQNESLLNQRVGLLNIDTHNVDKYFLFQALKTGSFEKEMINKGQGAAQKNISKNDIEGFIICLPHIEEQQKIANFLSAFDNKIEKEREKLEQLRELKRGLLQQMFV